MSRAYLPWLVGGAALGLAARRSRGETFLWRHREIPRFAWHKPPWSYDLSQGVKSYQPPSGRQLETRGIKEDFRRLRHKHEGGNDPVADEGVVWLAPEWPGTSQHYSRNGVRIDLSKLDPTRLLYTFQGERHMIHLGPIPPEALVVSGRQAVDWSRITPAQCEKLGVQIKAIQWRLWKHAADRLRGRSGDDRYTWSERAGDRLDRARYHLGEARYLLRSDSDGTLDNWLRASYDSEWASMHTAGYECLKPPCRPVPPSVRRKMLTSFVSDTRKLKQISRRLLAVEEMSSQRSDEAWRWVRWRPAYAWEAVNRITRAIEIIEPCVPGKLWIGTWKGANASCIVQSSLGEA